MNCPQCCGAVVITKNVAIMKFLLRNFEPRKIGALRYSYQLVVLTCTARRATLFSGMEWNGMEWNSGMTTPTECVL